MTALLKTSTLRPGLLVSLKTALVGNASYNKTDIERNHKVASGALKAKWQTERTIADHKEFDAAKIVRSKASSLVRSTCFASAFGLLCPEVNAAKLEKAVADARALADTFNAKAKITRLHVFIITGRIAPDDFEAVRAINSEVRTMLKDMEAGVKNLDVRVIRETAMKAKGMASMLVPEASSRILKAVTAARGAAREIVKTGEQAAVEVDLQAIKAIKAARTAFLDLDHIAEVAKPKAKGRGLDMLPVIAAKKAKAKSRQLEM